MNRLPTPDPAAHGRVHDLVIVGSGPAGYAAALYAARADLAPVVVEGLVWGGLLQTTTDVENYPGFPDGIDGPALMAGMRSQAERFGARMVTAEATAITVGAEDRPHVVEVGDEAYRARTLILATGSAHRHLDVPGEVELANVGVSYCATCDGAFFKGRPMIVVGGGDSAMEEATFLARFGPVAIVHRRDGFRASPVMVARARADERITLLTPYVVERLDAHEGPFARLAHLRHARTGTTLTVPFAGLFVAVGHDPQSQLVAGQVALGPAGHVLVSSPTTATSVPGVFAAGDLVDAVYRQAITSAGTGCAAALDAQAYLAALDAPPPGRAPS